MGMEKELALEFQTGIYDEKEPTKLEKNFISPDRPFASYRRISCAAQSVAASRRYAPIRTNALLIRSG